MNEYARDLFSISTYINHLQIILSRYSTKSVGLKIVLFPLFLLCLIFLIVAITPVFALGLLVKLFFEILIDDLIDKGSGFAMLAYMVFIEFFLLMYVILLLELILYGLLKLMSLGLGKTINEGPLDSMIKQNNIKKEMDEKSDIYVIDDENYK